jgi:hypothetical protein
MKLQINTGKKAIFVCSALVLLSCQFVTALAQQIVQELPNNARITKNEVIAVQVELRRLGFLKTRLSAELDPETRAAVKAYQAEQGLPITGKIDAPTYRKLGLPFPAPKPGDKSVPQQLGGGIKEGSRVGLEKSWDAGSYAASKSKDAAKFSWEGTKVAGNAAKRKADSMIRRDDEDVLPEIDELFGSHPEWDEVKYSFKEGMATIKLPPKSTVDIGALVSEVRKIAGVRSVFVVVL